MEFDHQNILTRYPSPPPPFSPSLKKAIILAIFSPILFMQKYFSPDLELKKLQEGQCAILSITSFWIET